MSSYPGGGIHVGRTGLLPPTTQPGGAWRTAANKDNDYQIDYEAQRTTHFFGVLNLSLQDQAMQEGMGSIFDRSREHLGSSDSGIIAVRRRMVRAAKGLRDGGQSAPGRGGQSVRVRSAALILPKEVSWIEASREHLLVRTGVDYTAV